MEKRRWKMPEKAEAYFEALHMPVFSCDSGLYFDDVAEEDQPGVHVRTVNGKYLSDEEMTAHYANLAKKYGGLTGHYQNAISLILDETHRYDAMEPSMKSASFGLVGTPHPKSKRFSTRPSVDRSADRKVLLRPEGKRNGV